MRCLRSSLVCTGPEVDRFRYCKLLSYSNTQLEVNQDGEEDVALNVLQNGWTATGDRQEYQELWIVDREDEPETEGTTPGLKN